MPVSGLLTQKLDSPVPEAGSTARFSIEVKPKKSGDGTWNKIKNEKGDFGEEYKILKADRKDDYQHPQHGSFAQYSLLIESVTSQEGAEGASSSNGGGAPSAASDSGVHWGLALKLASYASGTRDEYKSDEGYVDHIGALARKFYPLVIAGSADPKAPVVKTTQIPGVAEQNPQALKTDDDIPF